MNNMNYSHTREYIILPAFLNAVAISLCLLLSPSLLDAATNIISRQSVSSSGVEGNDHSVYPHISGDGITLEFTTLATNLTSGSDPFSVIVRNWKQSQTTKIDTGDFGDTSDFGVRFSTDGRYYVFSSSDQNLVAGDTNGIGDIFRYDQETNTTIRVSIATDGTEANSISLNPSISATGRYVVFESFANTLVTGDTNGTYDIFIHDTKTGVTERVSVKSDGSELPGTSRHATVSEDGNRVVFDTEDGVEASDNNGALDIYMRIRNHSGGTGITERITEDYFDQVSDGPSEEPVISPCGRYVNFNSWASNLVRSGDTNSKEDIFVWDSIYDDIYLISKSSTGLQSNDVSFYSYMSDDGRYICFMSDADNLVTGDSNGKRDVFIHDRTEGKTVRVSVAADGTEQNQDALTCTISGDGKYVAFSSWADNLVTGDNNGSLDIFLVRSPFLPATSWNLFMPAIISGKK